MPVAVHSTWQLHAVVFAPNDRAPNGYLFIVQRGLLALQGRVLSKGKVFGEDVVVQKEALRSTAKARALNYVSAYYISQTELFLLAQGFAATYRIIRRFASWMALRRQIVLLARLARIHKDDRTGQKSPSMPKIPSLLATLKFEVELETRGIDVSSYGTETAPATAVELTNGGSLAGYANNMALQFDVVNNRIVELQDELRRQSESAAKQAAEQAAQHAALAASIGESLEQMRACSAAVQSSPHAPLALNGTHTNGRLASLGRGANDEDRAQDGERGFSKGIPEHEPHRRRHRRSAARKTKEPAHAVSGSTQLDLIDHIVYSA